MVTIKTSICDDIDPWYSRLLFVAACMNLSIFRRVEYSEPGDMFIMNMPSCF
ncbi:UNVERIFIED_ORG: hypothetical protein J2806_004558 [Kosakonia oryzae]|uniref:Uncharacterized protein n=1 Tax=Kosakonia radicincitans TaxID=283686 RepID=A0AAX2EW15_9ENTR|nr:hypothetical protein [Kosakonia oryzae]SFF14220.1 hypothetical protein SAMN03159468_03902 [Kosakonia radicincitans]SFR21882.1 hypothetical protein SAMN03159514_03696 [Kosakonia radicincitans]SFT98229.1 hypothetical protein SAMN03159428_03157 [Kosakonia radicincitans]SFY13101.1 hypothetical protein SAMN03159436_03887 [Kosakonia radicincitans]